MSDDYRYPPSRLSLTVLPARHAPAAQGVQAPVAPPPPAEPAPLSAVEQKVVEGKVIQALREIYDPEIPVNIHELGLIYDIKVNPDGAVGIKMTLTAPACPVAGSLPGEVEKKVESIPEVKSANVELVWDPPWSRELMSEAALLTLGML